MRYQLIMLSLTGLLSACTALELNRQVTTLPDQELPYKSYTSTSSICQATDGGLAVALRRNNSNRKTGDYTAPYVSRNEVILTKTSPTGQIQWTKRVWAGANAAITNPYVYALADGGFLLFQASLKTAQAAPPISYYEPTILRISATGDVLSQQLIQPATPLTSFTVLGIVPLADKGFVIKSYTYEGSLTIPLLLRFDENGQLNWNRRYSQSPLVGTAYGLAATTDGGLILSSYGTNSAQATDGIVMKLDADGQSVWLKRYASVRAALISQSPDKGFVLLGLSPSPASLPTLYRLSLDGDLLGSQSYSLTTNQYAQPAGVFASASTYTAVYQLSPVASLEFLTTDLAGNEQGRQRIVLPTTQYPPTELIRLADGSLAYTASTGTGITLRKIKLDKTPDWETVLATNTQ